MGSNNCLTPEGCSGGRARQWRFTHRFRACLNLPCSSQFIDARNESPVQTWRCLCHSPIPVSPNNEARSPARSSKKGEKYEADATIGLGGFYSLSLLGRGGAGEPAHRAECIKPPFSLLP